MGNVLKGYRYRIVDNRSFDLPLPVKYVLLKEDNEIAEYEVSAAEEVSYKIITKYKENMITPITRPLTISDIYYFFSCRVFQDKTPFTGTELSLLGLERYNVYNIIRKTRGITPYDNYWLRFDGDKCNYLEAKTAWDELMSRVDPSFGGAPAVPQPVETGGADINEILNQHKVDVAAKISQDTNAVKTSEPVSAPSAPEPPASNTMSAAEIESLLMQSGLAAGFDEPASAPAEEPKPSGGNMSPDDIEKLLAAANAPVEESAPAEEPKPSGGNMSPDDIEKLLAAANAPVEESAPAEEPKPSGGNMSPDDIEKLLAAANAPAEESAPAEEPKPSGGKMSQADIEKMLAAASEAVQEPLITEPETSAEEAAAEESASAEETTPVEEPKPSGGKMSQADIEKMLAAASEAVQEPLITEPETSAEEAAAEESASAEETTPVEEPKPSGGKMSQADIEALLSGMADDAK